MSGMMNYSSGGLTIDPLTGRLVYPGQTAQQPPSPMSLPGILNSPRPEAIRPNPTSIPSGNLNYPGGLGVGPDGRLLVPPQNQPPRTGPAFPQPGAAMPTPSDPLAILKGGYGAVQQGIDNIMPRVPVPPSPDAGIMGAVEKGFSQIPNGDPSKFAGMDAIAPSPADPAEFAAMDANSLPSAASPAGAAPAPTSPVPSAAPTPTPPAQKDPLGDLQTKIAAGESSGGAKSGNLYGFIPSTWNAFVKQSGGKYTDKDITNPQAQQDAYAWNMGNNASYLKNQLGRDPTPAELMTAWNAGPSAANAFAQNPGMDAYQLYASITSPKQADEAFKNNPGTLVKGDTAAQAIARTEAFYNGQQGGSQTAQGGDAPTSNVLQTTTVGQPDAGQQKPSGDRGDDLQKSIMALKASPNDKLMALASGLLAGPTFNTGLSKGLQAMGELNTSDRNVGLQAANARAQMGYKDAMLGLGYNKLAQSGDIAQQRMDQQRDLTQQRIDQASGKIAFDQGDGKTTQLLLKDAVPKAAALATAAQDAMQVKELIANIRAIRQREPNTFGQDLVSRISQLTTQVLGVPVNGVTPSGLDIAAKDVNDLRTRMIRTNLGGRIGRQAFGEFQQLGKSAIDMKTNNQALDTLMDDVERAADRTLSANIQWEGKTPAERREAIIKYGGFDGWDTALQRDQRATSAGVGKPTNPDAPTIQPQPGGTGWQSTGSGVRWQVN